jgi:hypothetical protein
VKAAADLSSACREEEDRAGLGRGVRSREGSMVKLKSPQIMTEGEGMPVRAGVRVESRKCRWAEWELGQ